MARRTLCAGCEAGLTSTDREAGECTQCGHKLPPTRFDRMAEFRAAAVAQKKSLPAGSILVDSDPAVK